MKTRPDTEYLRGTHPYLKGVRFTVTQHDCVWTVRRYERNSYWTCEEPDHHTTCQFSEKEIQEGRIKAEAGE